MIPIAFFIGTLDPVWATLILSLAVLWVGWRLASKALDAGANVEASKQVFAAVGVLFGLLAAGGLGTLFAHSTAETAASVAKDASAGATGVSKEVGEVSSEVSKATEEIEELQKEAEGQEGKGKGKSGH